MSEKFMATVLFVIALMQLSCIVIKPLICTAIIKRCENRQSTKHFAEKAKKVLAINDWEFAIIMIIKVTIENKMGIPRSMPVIWFVDMILMNWVTAELIVKYVVRKGKKTK